MRKILLILLLIVAGSTASVVAQQRRATPEQEERLFMAKMKIIQEELKLNEQQTEDFAPLYRKYNDDMKELFKKHFKSRPKGKSIDAAKALEMATDRIDVKIELLKLQKGYYKQYAKVLTPEQLLRLDRAEQRIQFEIMKQGKRDKRGQSRSRRQNTSDDKQ